jgi:regulator of sigma E protease
MDFLYSIFGFLIAIGILVAVHEFGHLWVARRLGVKVLRYSIGFGKPIFKRNWGKDQTEYVLSAIPLGGYVSMLSEEDDSPEHQHDLDRAFERQPIWKRSLIMLAGPGINFLFAIFLFLILGSMPHQSLAPVLGDVPEQSIVAGVGIQSGDKLLQIDGKEYAFFGQHDLYIFNRVLQGQDFELQILRDGYTRHHIIPVGNFPIYNINPGFLARTLGLIPVLPQATTKLARVVSGSAADSAGLLEGDEIIAIDGQVIDGWAALVKQISDAPDRELQISVLRNESQVQLLATPKATLINGETKGRLGIAPTILETPVELRVDVNRSLGQAGIYGVEQTWLMSSVTLRMLWKMVTLQVSTNNISGPITIAQVSGQAIQLGLDYYLYILAVISISLGVMNLLPIPILDGGHLVMYAVELVAGQSVSQKVFAVGQRLGIVLLICLMSLAFYNDIFRLLN